MKNLFRRLALAATLAITAPYTTAMDEITKPTRHKHQQVTGKGVVVSTDQVRIWRAPMPEPGWPAMTMLFKMDEEAALKELEKGDEVEFELRKDRDEYAITRIEEPKGKVDRQF